MQQAYILHTRDYRDTSLLIEFFTQEQGRVSAIARGVRTAKSKQRHFLQLFTPLVVQLRGKGELLNINKIEPQGSSLILKKQALYSGFYLNELLVRLLHRHDPHLNLFKLYVDSLVLLQKGENIEVVLRTFELKLLTELGYGINFQHDSVGKPIKFDVMYHFEPDYGFTISQSDVSNQLSILGSHIVALAQCEFKEKAVLKAAKTICRNAIQHQLGDKTIYSRELFLSIPLANQDAEHSLLFREKVPRSSE